MPNIISILQVRASDEKTKKCCLKICDVSNGPINPRGLKEQFLFFHQFKLCSFCFCLALEDKSSLRLLTIFTLFLFLLTPSISLGFLFILRL